MLEVRQTLVPLGLRLDQFGNAAVGDHDTFSLDVGDGDLVPTGDVDDWFAVAQFLALTAADKLAAPSFESMTAGLRFGSVGIAADEGREASLAHVEYVLDPELPIDDPGQDLIRSTKTVRLSSSVPFVPPARPAAARVPRATGETVVELGVPAYVLTDTATMERSAPFTSWSAARQASTEGDAIERAVLMTTIVQFFSYLAQRAGRQRGHGGRRRRGDGTERHRRRHRARLRRRCEQRGARPRTPPVRLSGPGEVLGLVDAEVIREYPEPGATDAEPNYFPYVELRTPDLPWRYSTGRP